MSQEAVVISMLRQGPQTTNDFCSRQGMAAEYRRAISTARVRLRTQGEDITCERINRKTFLYRIVPLAPVVVSLPPVSSTEAVLRDLQQPERAGG